MTTRDGYKLSLAAILPLVKHNRTAAEAYLDDSIMDFCVKTGALQPKDGVLYARSWDTVEVRASDIGKYSKIVCRHHVPNH